MSSPATSSLAWATLFWSEASVSSLWSMRTSTCSGERLGRFSEWQEWQETCEPRDDEMTNSQRVSFGRCFKITTLQSSLGQAFWHHGKECKGVGEWRHFMNCSFGTRYSDTDALLPHWYNAMGSILRLGVWLRWLRAMLYLRRVTTPWGSMSFLKMLHLDCKAGSWASPRCPAMRMMWSDHIWPLYISLPGTLQHPEVLQEKRKFVYDLARKNGFSAWAILLVLNVSHCSIARRP